MLKNNKHSVSQPTFGGRFGWKDSSKPKGTKDIEIKSDNSEKEVTKVAFKGFVADQKIKDKDESEISFGQHNIKGTDIVAMVKTYLEVYFSSF